MPTVALTGAVLLMLFFAPLLRGGNELSPNLEKQFSALQLQAMQARLIPMPLGRPVNCPVASVAFADIAEQMSDLALSLTDSKCYEKHAKTIADLARLSGDNDPGIVKNMAPPENGALIEHNPQQVINITNTQIQNVKNQNAVITGFFSLAKDKTCIDSFRRQSKLASAAGTLAKIGTLSLFLPSQAGLSGSAVSFLIGGSLLALDRMIQPKFTWKHHKDRRDFMAMTCAFYHLRNNLFYAGFFDVATPQDPERLDKAELLDHQLDALQAASAAALQSWEKIWDQRLLDYVGSRQAPERTTMCRLIKGARQMLTSPMAAGLNVDERLTLQSYFSTQLPELSRMLQDITQPEARKVIGIISSLEKFTHEEILTLSRMTWQLAYVQSTLFYLDHIGRQQCSENDLAVADFYQRNDFDSNLKNSAVNDLKIMAHHTLVSRISTLRHSITWSTLSIKRLSEKKSLSSFDDGAMNYFDILLEYQNITKDLVGKKGWSFVEYLLELAEDNICTFTSRFAKWQKLRDAKESTQVLCRDGFVIEKFYDLADSAIEFAYDYLMATDELWSSVDKKSTGFWHLVPFFQSNATQVARASEATQLARAVLEAKSSYSSAELSSVQKQIPHPMGKVVITVKNQEANRQQLHNFSKANCYNTAPR